MPESEPCNNKEVNDDPEDKPVHEGSKIKNPPNSGQGITLRDVNT
jgi:hypothetical protein